MASFDRSAFLRELKEAFPQLRAAINVECGLLHLEMHAFANFAQDAISVGNADAVRICFRIAARYHIDGNESMKNALVVSFLEHLDLRNAPWAWELLGDRLGSEYLRCGMLASRCRCHTSSRGEADGS
jgi:hypothetical protein